MRLDEFLDELLIGTGCLGLFGTVWDEELSSSNVGAQGSKSV